MIITWNLFIKTKDWKNLIKQPTYYKNPSHSTFKDLYFTYVPQKFSKYMSQRKRFA